MRVVSYEGENVYYVISCHRFQDGRFERGVPSIDGRFVDRGRKLRFCGYHFLKEIRRIKHQQPHIYLSLHRHDPS